MLPGFAQSSMVGLIAMYALPIGSTVIAAVLVVSGVQVKPPDALVGAIERLFARVSGSVRRRRRAAGAA